jgi:glucose/arabinose dehydrogenase
MWTSLTGSAILIASLLGFSEAQKCAGAGRGKPTNVAKGFTSYVLASGLSSPRGLIFDKEGNLLVVEKTTTGTVTAIKLKEEGGCVTVASKHSTGATGPGGSVLHQILLSGPR